MYVVISGHHPLHVSGESLRTYLKKLDNPKWEFGPEFSPLAQSLFLKLVKTSPLERYSAKEALQHPWITRTPGIIPLSYTDSMSYGHAKEKLCKVTHEMYLLKTRLS